MSNPLNEFFRCPPDHIQLSSPDRDHDALAQVASVCPSDGHGHSTPLFLDRMLRGDIKDLAITQPLPTVFQIIDDLRFERYTPPARTATGALLSNPTARYLYYLLRPMLSSGLRRSIQRLFLRDWDRLGFPAWPVDTTVEDILERLLIRSMQAMRLERLPFVWFWPNGASSAAMITHDAENAPGLSAIPQLIALNESFDIRASFQLVPERRYHVSKELLGHIRARRCEVNVHGVNHEGNLFGDREAFLKNAEKVKHYLEEFGAEGFRSPCMYRNVDWFGDLGISYDMSVPNVAHLEPQRGGCCTVFPYFVGQVLELPLTTAQDYSLFNILGDYSIELWKRQTEIITSKHGLASFIVHPDYSMQGRQLEVYKALLGYLSELRTSRNLWIALPGEVNRWWRERSNMEVVLEGGSWRISGVGHERARIAFATLSQGQLTYEVTDGFETADDITADIPLHSC